MKIHCTLFVLRNTLHCVNVSDDKLFLMKVSDKSTLYFVKISDRNILYFVKFSANIDY